MKHQLMKFAVVLALGGGTVFAQASGTTPAPATGNQGVGVRAPLRHRLIQALNLTADQKQQAKSIFQQARQTAQPVAQQARENRQALEAAVKANQADQIRQLAVTQGNLQGQLLAVRSEAMASFYNILTPDQRAKADQIVQHVKQRLQRRLGQGNNG